jgi:5,10-methylenetetrahydromethanopterin reductase
MRSLGMKLDAIPTERVVALAREIEERGLDEVWVCEDLGRNGGIAQAAMALGATRRIRVGLGIVPAAVRNPAYLAMELASVCRTHPGRFIPGIGHGMPEWLRQVGAHPGKLLPRLEETTVVVSRLLAGETVDFSGTQLRLENVTLDYPPAEPPPILLGVRGPKGIEMASRVAGGVILAEGSGPRYVASARERLGPDGHITVFASFASDEDGPAAVERLRPAVAAAFDADFMQSQLGELAAEGPTDRVLAELTVSGTASDCADAIERLYEAGADAVVLQPIPGTEAEELDRIAPLLARVRSS